MFFPTATRSRAAACALLALTPCLGCSGLTPATIKTLPDTPSAVAQLKAGKVDAVIGDYPVMAYMARESVGRLEVVGTQFETGTYGIAVSKQAHELNAAVRGALAKTMQDKTYFNILSTWAIHLGKVDPPDAAPTPATAQSAVQLQDGVLNVGIEPAFAPMEFLELNREVGADIELSTAIAAQLGVEVKFEHLAFDDLLGAVENGQVDVALSSITVTPERERLVSFIPYLEAGSGILVQKGNPGQIQRLADLCGKIVALQEGTSQIAIVKAVKCEQ